MEEVGVHLHNSIKLFDTLFHHGAASPLINLSFTSLTDLLGATAEFWPQFLPSEIDSITRSGFTVNYKTPTQEKLKQSANELLEQSCKVRSLS